MFHRDERKISKARSPFSRFANYLRSAFGRDHTPSKKDKTHSSIYDLNRSTPDTLFSNNSSLKVGENGSDYQTVNHASSAGNLTDSSPSVPAPSNRFRDELAAKLSAGPGFPFGGLGGPPRLGVVAPPVTVNPSTFASGDTTPASLSPGSPSTSVFGSREANLGGSAGESGGIKDSYMEGAMLRINLNRQRKHRGRTKQPSPTSPEAAAAVTSTPLHRISEVDTVDSPTEQDVTHSSPRHSPPIFPKPRVLRNSSKASSAAKDETTVETPNSPKIQSSRPSADTLDVAESTEPKTPTNPDKSVFHEEKAKEKENQETLDDQINTEPKSPQANREIVTGGLLGNSSSRSSAHNQEEGGNGGSDVQEFPFRSSLPSPPVMRSSNGVRNRSLGESDCQFQTQKQVDRPISSSVEFSSQRQLKRINSGGKQQEGSHIAVPPKVEEETEGRENSDVHESSSPYVASSTNVASVVEESKEKLPVEGFMNIRLRASSNRQNPPNDGA